MWEMLSTVGLPSLNVLGFQNDGLYSIKMKQMHWYATQLLWVQNKMKTQRVLKIIGLVLYMQDENIIIM